MHKYRNGVGYTEKKAGKHAKNIIGDKYYENIVIDD